VACKEAVNTEYLNAKANELLDHMDRTPFGHFLISGPAGAGKISLLKLTSELYRHDNKPGIIVVTLESTFDSKNLVGTYVCNETGEF
jgi:type II secretory ATPase GspE/PulE/Tfp pilus assembly ATPase PilB-like protein